MDTLKCAPGDGEGTSEMSVRRTPVPERVENVELGEMLAEMDKHRCAFAYEQTVGDDVNGARVRDLWSESGEKMIGYLLERNVDPAQLTHAELFNALQELWLWGSSSKDFCEQHPMMNSLREECERRLREYYFTLGAPVLSMAFHESSSGLGISVIFERRTLDGLNKNGVIAQKEVVPLDGKNPDLAVILLFARGAGEKLMLSLDEVKRRVSEEMLEQEKFREAREKLKEVLGVDEGGHIGLD